MALNTHTIQDVITYVRRQFGDESGVQIVPDDIIRWINQGQMEINSKNQVLRSKVTTTSISGTNTYDKPADCLRLMAVRYDTTLLSYIGFDQYQSRYSGPQSPDVPVTWTQFGDSFLLSPTPNSDTTTISLYYVPETPVLGKSTDVLSLPDRYFDRLCEYVMSKAYELDEDWNAHSVQRNLFEQGLVGMSNEETNSQGPYPVVVDYSYDMYTYDNVWY